MAVGDALSRGASTETAGALTGGISFEPQWEQNAAESRFSEPHRSQNMVASVVLVFSPGE